MFSVERCLLPDDALLYKYVRSGAYTDCYRTEVSDTVSHAEYVEAFYTTPLFKLERIILKWMVSKPSSDSQATQLAEGKTDTFSAWRLEDRSENQLLLSDFQGRTRSWLMAVPADLEDSRSTVLFFGSAVVPAENPDSGKTSLGTGFSLLLGFHKIYSVLLLYSAKRRLMA